MAEAPNTPTPPAEDEMSLWGHLEDLRWTVVRAVIGIVVGMIICGYFFDEITNYVILAPTAATTPKMELMNTEVYGQLSVWMQIVMWGGIVLSFPYTLVQVWKFIAPGLHQKEKHYVRQITIFTVLSFVAGMAFAYFVMLPMVLDFAMGFVIGTGGGTVKNMIEIHKYLSVFLEIVMISGLVFELPLIAYFLGRMGILTPAFLRHYRRHAIVLLLAAAAFLSPGGNPILQLILFGPLWALFEISVATTAIAARQRRKAEAAIMS